MLRDKVATSKLASEVCQTLNLQNLSGFQAALVFHECAATAEHTFELRSLYGQLESYKHSLQRIIEYNTISERLRLFSNRWMWFAPATDGCFSKQVHRWGPLRLSPEAVPQAFGNKEPLIHPVISSRIRHLLRLQVWLLILLSSQAYIYIYIIYNLRMRGVVGIPWCRYDARVMRQEQSTNWAVRARWSLTTLRARPRHRCNEIYGTSPFSFEALHFGMIRKHWGFGSGECEDKLCEQKPEDCISRAGGNLQQPWMWFAFAEWKKVPKDTNRNQDFLWFHLCNFFDAGTVVAFSRSQFAESWNHSDVAVRHRHGMI